MQAQRTKPGQTAAELARGLGRDRPAINQRLYGSLRGQVEQDASHRRRLAGGAACPDHGDAGGAGHQDARTDLAKLARFHLACLGFDDAGVSSFLTSRDGDPDYAELTALTRTPAALADSIAARQLLGRKRTERTRYGLYFGYPTSITHVRFRRRAGDGLMVEPILLSPLEQDLNSVRLTLDPSFPIVNRKPLRAFSNAEPDMIMNELVQLEQELGLGRADEPPDLDELAMWLQAVREEWLCASQSSRLGSPVRRAPSARSRNRASTTAPC